MTAPDPAARALGRYVRAIREMHDRGFTVDVIVDIALKDRPRRFVTTDEIVTIRRLYLEKLPKGLVAS